MTKEDERCCGTGHCMINADGQCWCGQQWDGEKMCSPKPLVLAPLEPEKPAGNDNQPSLAPKIL
jgi:hypothetical protein